jgi:hypothetical protein
VLLAQGRFWKVSWVKASGSIVLAMHRDSLPEELRDLRELRIDVPLDKWNRVAKHVRSDRKLLGGILLDFAKHKDHVGVAVGNDRLFFELQRALVDSTVSLVETGTLSLSPVEVGGT